VTRGWFCRLQLLLVLASVVIYESESRGTRVHILLCEIRHCPFRRLLRFAGLRWRYSTPPPRGIPTHWLNWLWVLCYDRRSVGQSILEWNTHLGLTTRFLLLSNSCWFVDVGCCLWREDGSAVYNCCWSSPAQSFSGGDWTQMRGYRNKYRRKILWGSVLNSSDLVMVQCRASVNKLKGKIFFDLINYQFNNKNCSPWSY
jgi:hypothetical protein